MDYNNPCEKKMYLTLSPCEVCAKAIVNANIKEVIYSEFYRHGKKGIGEGQRNRGQDPERRTNNH